MTFKQDQYERNKRIPWHRRWLGLCFSASAFLLTFGPSPALGAGTVSTGCGFDSCVAYVTSGPETNDFRVQVEASGVIFRDLRPGAQLIDGADECLQTDPATVTCGGLGAPPYRLSPVLQAGDSFDPGITGCDDGPFALVAASLEADGGAAPTLVGTAADDEINTFGNAAVNSCAGNDDLTSSGSNGEQLTASLGPGKDDLSTEGRLSAVIDGEAGKDSIQVGHGVVHGGTDADVIYEGRGHSEIFGDEGNDFLGSGEGKDLLDGGSGADKLEAGQRRRGNAIRVRVLPGASDRLRCGPGRDQALAGRNSSLHGCERVRHLPQTVIQA